MAHLIKIKPLSVNNAWQGKRFKTPAYVEYERDVLFMLPKVKLPPTPFKIEIEYGFSNSASDIDNPTKPLLDIMQKKYGFNDSQVHELNLKKVKVKKGEDYFKFEILSLNIL